jgi:hypothetical protein
MTVWDSETLESRRRDGMKYPNIDSFRPNERYFEEIFPCVWLMDNHRWAYYAWEYFIHKNPGVEPQSLIHLDYHWDGVNDLQNEGARNNFLNTKNLEGISELVSRNTVVRKDSFIAAGIIRGIINQVHFYCLQTDTEVGVDAQYSSSRKVKQFIHKNPGFLSKKALKGSLFDIDLDLFNNSDFYGTGDLWSEERILSFVDSCSELIMSAPLVTIAMSFGESGSRKDTKYLTRLVVPKIVQSYSRRLAVEVK